jgi:A/G-specific adenine glycosylase
MKSPPRLLKRRGQKTNHDMTFEEFQKTILDYYIHYGRTFPWRTNLDPWGVLLSEFMLQQTQTLRVVPYWETFTKRWPRPADLAGASLEEVLKEWSGLGYNRRAKMLRECARSICEKHGGAVPDTPEKLLTLPGIGPYSSGAIACFAWNYPAVFIETNIRAVLIHFFFQDRADIGDDELFPILAETLDQSNPRIWYWALMDYGAELKKLTANPNRKSSGYTRQSRFEGSFRQIRGAIIRQLAAHGGQSAAGLKKEIGKILKDMKDEDCQKALDTLEKEMMVAEEAGVYRIK